MEHNQEMKIKKKSLIPLIACIAVVAVCALATVGVLISKNFGADKEVATGTERIEIEQNEAGEMLAKDEASLRQLLMDDATYTIAITEDIYVSEPLTVNGTKTLVGDKSIIMNLNTDAKQRVCLVSADAYLILDGATIDGNGVSSGIEVEDGGKLDCLSGSIVYPMPYGIVTEGVVNVEDITIDRSMHTGIYVEAGGELYMNGGKITNCIQTGIATSTQAYAKVSKDTVIQKSAGSLFYNFGTLDITGGTFSDSYSNCIYNKGELNIISESDDKLVEFFNSGRSIISSVAGTSVTIDGIYVHDIAAHVMNLEKDSVGDIKNVLVENTGKSAFYTNSSKLTMKDIEIKDIKSVGINLTNKSTVELENITILNGGHRGIVNDTSTVKMKNITVDNLVGAGIITIGEKSVTTIEKAKISKVGKSGIGITGGTVTAKDIEITDAAGTSIYTTTDKSKTTIDGAKLVNSGKSAIGVSVGTLTAKDVEINGTKNTGIYIQKGAKLDLSNAKIKGVNKHGIANYFGTAVVKNVSVEAPTNAGILNQGTLTGEKVTINKAGSRAMSLTDASTTNIKGLAISESKNQSVYIDAVTSAHISNFEIDKAGQSAFRITKSTDVLLKSGTITSANGDGIYVAEKAKIKVQDTTITKPVKHGVEVVGEGAEVTAINVAVNEPARAGLVNNGGTVNGNTVAVNGSQSRSVSLINKSTTSITGLTVKNAGDQAVYVDGTTKVVLKEFEIDRTKNAAIRVSKSKDVSIKTGTIKNAGSDGIYSGDGAAIKVQDVVITKPAAHGLDAVGAEITAINVTVNTPARAGVVNNGGTIGGNAITVNNSGSRAVSLINKSTTTITGLTVKNAGDQAVYVDGTTKVVLKEIEIDKTKNAAIRVSNATDVSIKTGTIKNAGSDGVYACEAAAMKVQDVTITKPAKHGLNTVGAEITAVNVTVDTPANAGIVNDGGTIGGNVIKITNSGSRAVSLINKSTTTITGLTVKNAGDQAVYVDGTTKVVLKEIEIDKTKNAAIRVSNAKDVSIKTGTIKNAGSDGVYACEAAAMKVENVKITKPAKHGLNTVGAEITAVNVTVDAPANAGVVNDGGTINGNTIKLSDTGSRAVSLVNKSTTSITGLTVKNAGDQAVYIDDTTKVVLKEVNVDATKSAAIRVSNSENVSIKTGTIKNAGGTGVYVGDASKIKVEAVNIIDVPSYGLECVKAEIIANDISMQNVKAGIVNTGGSIKGNTISIDTTSSRAINLTGGSVTEIVGLTVKNAGDQGVYAEGSAATISGFTVDTTKNAAVSLAVPEETEEETVVTKVTLSNGTIKGAGSDGIYVEKNTEADLTGVTVENAGRHSIYNHGGKLTSTTLTINQSTNRAVSASAGSETTINGVNIAGTGDQAVYIDGGKAQITGFEISGSGAAAVRVSNSEDVVIKTGTIKNAGGDGIYAGDASKVTVGAVDIIDAADYGIECVNAEITANNINMQNVKAGIVNTGGTINGKTISIDTTTSRALSLTGGSVTEIVGLTVKNAGNQGVYAENSTVNVSSFTVDTTKSAAFCLGKTEEIDATAVEDVTLTDGTIKNSGSTGIYVAETATANVTGVTIEDAGQHGIQNAGGKLIGKKLTINQSANRAVTMSTGSETTIHGLDITGTGIGTGEDGQAVYVDGGKVEITGFEISETAQAAVRVFRTKDVKLTDGTINATTYGIAISNEASAIAEDVRILRQAGNTTELIHIFTGAELILQNGENTVTEKQSAINGQGYEGRGIYVDGIFNMSGGTISGHKDSENGEGTIGTGVYVAAGAKLIMNGKDAVIENNYSKEWGAGVAVYGTFEMTAGKIQNNEAANEGAGVYVAKDATFTMSGEDSYIQFNHATSSKNGGGVIAYGTFNMNGGTIYKNTANKGAGVFVRSSGTLVMTDGEISSNEADDVGGGIYTMSANTTVSGGTIVANVAKSTTEGGGGVYVHADGTFNMNAPEDGGTTAAEIKENVAAKYGAGVLVRGTFIMDAGTISNHGSEEEHLAVEGAGVCLVEDSAAFTMNGGEIKNNYGAKAGVGVSMRDGNAAYPIFTMNGGKITENESTGNASGIVARTGVFTMNEGATVSSNKTKGLGGGLYLAGTATFKLNGGTFENNSADNRGKDIHLEGKITLQKALTDAISISLNTYSTSKVVALNGGITDEAFADSMSKIFVEAADMGSHWYVNDKGVLTAPIVLKSSGASYAALADAVEAAADEDTITILRNQEIANTIKITKELTLTSNTKVAITANDALSGDMFEVAKEGTLVINGAAEEGNEITLEGSEATNYVINNSGTTLLSNVDITGGVRGVHNNGGTVGTAGNPLTNVSISDTSNHGFYAYGGNVNIGDITVQRAGYSAIYIQRPNANVTIQRANIYDFAEYGLVVKNGTVTVKNTVIDNQNLTDQTKRRVGIAAHGGTLNLDNVTVQNIVGKVDSDHAKMSHGIELLTGAQLNVTANEAVSDGINKGVYIKNVDGDGIYADSGKMNIFKITVEDAGNTAIYILNTKEDDVLINNAQLLDSVKIGFVLKAGVATLKNTVIDNENLTGLYEQMRGIYADSNAILNLDNVKIQNFVGTGNACHGIHLDTGAQLKVTSVEGDQIGLSITKVYGHGIFVNKSKINISKVSVNGTIEGSKKTRAGVQLTESSDPNNIISEANITGCAAQIQLKGATLTFPSGTKVVHTGKASNYATDYSE